MNKTFTLLAFLMLLTTTTKAQQIGDVMDTYNEVPVYYNGKDFVKSHGESHANDGYFLGQKWQCVEFVRRYFYTKHNFKFPVWQGHAKSFLNFLYDQGQLNKERNCHQFYNGDTEKPQVDDILVFCTSMYGHVCIVSKVEENRIEVVQQNMENHPRAFHDLKEKNGKYFIGNDRAQPVGFLRINKK